VCTNHTSCPKNRSLHGVTESAISQSIRHCTLVHQYLSVNSESFGNVISFLQLSETPFHSALVLHEWRLFPLDLWVHIYTSTEVNQLWCYIWILFEYFVVCSVLLVHSLTLYFNINLQYCRHWTRALHGNVLLVWFLSRSHVFFCSRKRHSHSRPFPRVLLPIPSRSC